MMNWQKMMPDLNYFGKPKEDANGKPKEDAKEDLKSRKASDDEFLQRMLGPQADGLGRLPRQPRSGDSSTSGTRPGLDCKAGAGAPSMRVAPMAPVAAAARQGQGSGGGGAWKASDWRRYDIHYFGHGPDCENQVKAPSVLGWHGAEDGGPSLGTLVKPPNVRRGTDSGAPSLGSVM
uniref:Uncharacterized protein n=1 Tax=Pyrodinium bahamense TaxID=73915 RepID=A0A7S0A3M4_9DINO|mmetsp:Transcript_21130/g.58578  ORF Transcript_21130/g.58578 Transcript_21130/m.58578 type:complete len:177 (+) Transcript_21130:99-629(+)